MRILKSKDRLLWTVLLIPLPVWLLMFFLAPLAGMLVRSFWIEDFGAVIDYFSLENYQYFFARSAFARMALKSIFIGVGVVVLSLGLGYPMAYLLARKVPEKYQMIATMTLLFPFLTAHVVRIFSWMTILGREGFVNKLLMLLGLVNKPVSFLLYSNTSTVIALTYVLMPMMIMPCYIALRRIDPSLSEASDDLGANVFQTFFRITLPISKYGIVAGALLIFPPAVGAYFEPLLLGGTQGSMIGNILANHFTGAIMWSRGAALAFLLMVILTLFVVGFLRLTNASELDLESR
jgi:spermidine/putrescine transport system permease protein